MSNIWALIKSHPTIFILLALAFALDITGVMSSIMPGAIFGIPSLMLIVYTIGLAMLIRFVIARRRVHLAVTWPVIIVLYFGWFIIIAVLTDGQSYRPSLLFVLCLFAAYKTLRFSVESESSANVPNELKDDETV